MILLKIILWNLKCNCILEVSKTKNTMKIQIPEPCHENWKTMTPNEQGRFCGSCQKTVVDFTRFSTHDVQNYFTKHYGQKVCGRFKNEQLSAINIQIPSYIFIQISASKRFALALLIVFGTTLFSCTDNNGNNANIGKVELVDSISKPKETITSNTIGKTVNPNEEGFIKPKTKQIPKHLFGNTLVNIPEKVECETFKGEVLISNDSLEILRIAD